MVRKTRKSKRGGAYNLMTPVPDTDYILLDIESIKGRFSHPIRDSVIKTLEELVGTEGFSDLHITEIKSANLGHKYLLFVLEGHTIVCTMSFTINDSASNMGYIDFVSSTTKSAIYRPSSYLAFYQVFKIFEHFKIPYCYLYVLPEEDRYWKLYNFYAAIGFYCLPYEKADKTIHNVVKLSANARNAFFLEHKATNTFLRNHRNVEHSRENATAYFYGCQHMMGKVSDMLEKVKTVLNIP